MSSAIPRIGESFLLQGYGLGMRVEHCACGGFVGALLGDEASAVFDHNGSELHLMWRSWMDMLDERRGIEVPIAASTAELGL